MSEEAVRATVPRIGDSAHRPVWTVLIPTWNCAKYLEETLGSVLAQDPGPDRMEIIVVDDHSTLDDPEEVTRRLGGSRVRFFRQPQNVGKVRNYEAGLLQSRGMLIHQLHGDDRVRPGFYAAMDDAFSRFPAAGAFFCQSLYINERGEVIGETGLERDVAGLLDGWLALIAVEQRIQTPSMVVKREVYETVGAFDRRLDMCEDWEMWTRIAMRFPIGFVPRALAEYRISASNTSATATRAGRHAEALTKVTRIIDGYLPPEITQSIRRARNRALAQHLIQVIPSLMKARLYSNVARLYVDALRFSADAQTWYRLFSYTRNYKRLPGG